MIADSRAAEGHGYKRPLLIALATTVCVTVLSYVLPRDYEATGVGLAFLGITYLLVLRDDDVERIRRVGLSFGGVLEPSALDPKRIVRDTLIALGWTLAVCVVVFPLFWLGFVNYQPVARGFTPAPWSSLRADVLGELLVIALPEEAFYRGYLQSALDDAWAPRWKVLGARIGPGLIVTSALFALGHFATVMHPDRLAVFFPALLFGWLRARTGGVGAPILLHAACNLFSAYLARSYGLG